MIRCTVGVFAYNEEANIVPVLQTLLAQRLSDVEIVEIVVVASGCTDGTAERARQVARDHAIVQVEMQTARRGKAAAISSLLRLARGEVIVLCGADTLPDPDAIEQLVRPFADPSVGMTGARIVPLNDPRRYPGFAVQLLWHMHHRLALRAPKLGELVAFRHVIDRLPEDVVADEVALEALITARGYRLAYAPDALVYNRGPETIRDFVAQRRRIFAGHLHVVHTYRYVAASLSLRHVAPLMAEAMAAGLALLPWTIATIVLELWARSLGTLDFWRGHRHHVWRPIATTKRLHEPDHVLTLVTLSCPPGSLGPLALVRAMRRIPESEGRLFWWDPAQNQVRFALRYLPTARRSLSERVSMLAGYLGEPLDGTRPALSYCAVQFKPARSVSG